MDTTTLASLFKQVDRPLWIITSELSLYDDGNVTNRMRAGLLASWVSQASLSLEQPAILIGLGPNHNTTRIVLQSNHFTAHLLSEDQVDTAFRFGGCKSAEVDKFVGLEVEYLSSGSPVLTECVGYFECEVFAKLDTGDRIYFWGDVINANRQIDKPLLTESHFFGALDEDSRRRLRADRDSDLEMHGPRHAAWRQAMPAELRPGSPTRFDNDPPV